MKKPVLNALPPAVVIVIFADLALVGTMAVTCLSLTTVKLAMAEPNFTAFVCMRLTPVMVTFVATGPLVGVNELITGRTWKFWLLTSLPVGVVSVIGPVVAPSGTVAVRNVSEITVNVAAAPLSETDFVPVNPCPRSPTEFLTFPHAGTIAAYGFKLASTL